MKTTYLKITAKLKEANFIKMIARDRGQIDKYEGKPQVIFPCALISISLPKRKNLDRFTQNKTCTITIRLAFERLYDDSNLNSETNQLKALEYYDRIEQVDGLFQGFTDPHFSSPWECTATIDEQRPDYDIVRFTYVTNFIK